MRSFRGHFKEKIMRQSLARLLSDLRACISQLDESEYNAPRKVFSGFSIGEHCRHILEFVICFEEQHKQEVIDYDLRKRNLNISSSTIHAISTIDWICEKLENIPEKGNVQLAINLEMQKDEKRNIPTTLEREWVYLIEHTVHHMAIIKTGLLADDLDIGLPSHFGVAASTIRYLSG